jgi:hypothetical protein
MPPISKEAILMAALMMLVVVWAQSPAAFPDMSAEMVSSANGHQNVGHFYTSKGKVRVESSRGSVMIFDSANRTGWLLNPRQRTAMDMSSQMKGAGHEVNPMMPQGPVDPNNPCAASPGSTCKKLKRM